MIVSSDLNASTDELHIFVREPSLSLARALNVLLAALGWVHSDDLKISINTEAWTYRRNS